MQGLDFHLDKMYLFRMERTEQEYRTAAQAATKWGMTSRNVRFYAQQGRIPGARMEIRFGVCLWLIPKWAKKPGRKT